MNGKIYVIKSDSERGFWNSTQGWVYRISSATKFHKDKLPNFMPLSRENDAEFTVYEYED